MCIRDRIYAFVKSCFADRTGRLQFYPVAGCNEDDAMGADLLGLVEEIEQACTLHSVVAAELLVHHEVAHGLAEHGVREGLQKLLLLSAEVHRINMVEEMGRAGIGHFCRIYPFGEFRKVHRIPVTVEIFVGEVLTLIHI